MSLADAFPVLFPWVKMVLFIVWLVGLVFLTWRMFWYCIFCKERDYERDGMSAALILAFLFCAWIGTLCELSCK